MNDPEFRARLEVRIEPPPQALVEAQGTIDVSHRHHDDLKVHVRRRLFIDVRGAVLLCDAHNDLPCCFLAGFVASEIL
ncbi:hypothetical protein OG756_04500 [Streptomyces sp. NBC_01310]|uniref:hypothetical protein n=1 Tax=Streptomyces sp. NBC_01310 TaxID=2903820 RepID=UPI0035B65456|nr:hypothetical protein OG756_04500 [Streptomyces sp. NBC_01310]